MEEGHASSCGPKFCASVSTSFKDVIMSLADTSKYHLAKIYKVNTCGCHIPCKGVGGGRDKMKSGPGSDIDLCSQLSANGNLPGFMESLGR